MKGRWDCIGRMMRVVEVTVLGVFKVRWFKSAVIKVCVEE